MLASSSTMMGLLIVVYTMVMSSMFAYAFMMYHRGNAVWKFNLSVGAIMLLMMVLSLL